MNAAQKLNRIISNKRSFAQLFTAKSPVVHIFDPWTGELWLTLAFGEIVSVFDTYTGETISMTTQEGIELVAAKMEEHCDVAARGQHHAA